MAFYYDSYYANTPAKKVRTQPKRECNNITYIYMNRDKRTIHNEPQYEARLEATKQNMFGFRKSSVKFFFTHCFFHE